MRGPIDFIILGFEGNKFNGAILRELGNAIDQHIIRLMALSVIRKDEGGMVTTLDASTLNDDILVDARIHIPNNSVISDEDIEEVASLLEDNTSAGLLIIEHLWAKPLKQAIIEAHGVLVAEGRIHPGAADELTNETED